MTPIKRHPQLQPLSREHHCGLLFCWKIREGFRLHVQPERIKQFAQWFWESHLKQHFQTEELLLFPVLGTENPKIRQALAEHHQLKMLFESLTPHAIHILPEMLECHIRFEERDLFNEIQQTITEHPFHLLMDRHETQCGEYEDEFWKIKN